MFTSRITIGGDVAGVPMSGNVQRQAEGQIGQSVTLNAAKAGTLTTRTTDTAGTITLGAGHGIVDADVVDIYWSGGRRYNVVVGTVAGNDVPISGGAGDNLPAQDAALTLAKQQTIDMDFEGDLLEACGAVCPQRGHIGFFDGASLVLSVDLAANTPWLWWKNGGHTNPLASQTITQAKATQEISTGTAELKLGVLYDSA
ncbi:MAG: hypothetical protein HRF50_04500 [Phycisphaerae bacterium]|jgi:hypothetical protein